jgi:hypothetical protein
MKHIFTVFIIFFTITAQAQVGIGTTNPDASAKLDITSATQGLLPPRMTTAQRDAISLPATGLQIYNTDKKAIETFTGTTGLWFTVGMGNGTTNHNDVTNTAVGVNVLKSITTSIAADGYNTGVGFHALFSNTTGFTNTAIGYNALYSNIGGSFNTAVGYTALNSNTGGYIPFTGSYNTAIGFGALFANTTGNNNTASGYRALNSNTTGSFNTASGYRALNSNTTGSFNTASGYQALNSNTTGNNNTASGYQALNSNTTGFDNTAYGQGALRSNTERNNTAIGSSALSFNTTGYDNTALGYKALNTGIFFTGSNCTVIGSNAQTSTNSISNEITLGNSSITSLRAQVTSITALSDRRDKTDIIPIVEGLAFIKQLNPVSFTWNTRDKAKVGIKSAGFIAQDLLALQKQSNIGDNLDLVSENNPEKLEARYGNLLPIIVKAIQEESAEKDQKISNQDKEIKALNERLDALEKQIKQMLNK